METKIIKFFTLNDIRDYLNIVSNYPNITIDMKIGSYIIDGKSYLGIISIGLYKDIYITFSDFDESLYQKLNKFFIGGKKNE